VTCETPEAIGIHAPDLGDIAGGGYIEDALAVRGPARAISKIGQFARGAAAVKRDRPDAVETFVLGTSGTETANATILPSGESWGSPMRWSCSIPETSKGFF